MATCARCNFIAPPSALNCPRCHLPLMAVQPQAHSPYEGPRSAYRRTRGGPSKKILMGAGALVTLVVGALAVTQKMQPEAARDVTPIEAPRSDGWRPFRPEDDAFRVEFPAKPVREEGPLEGNVSRRIVTWRTEAFDMGFRVEVVSAPEFVPSYQVASRLQEWFQPIFQEPGSTLESSIQLVSPKGDQVFDAVVVDAKGRNWVRLAMWKGNLIAAVAVTDAKKEPTPQQIEAWRRFRDSLGQ